MTILLFVGFGIAATILGGITVHSAWFSGRLLRGISDAQWTQTIRLAQMQQEGLDAFLKTKP